MKTSQRNLWLARGEQEEDIVARNGSRRRVSRGLVSVPAKIRRVMSGKEGVSGSHEKYSGNLKLAVAGLWPPFDLEGRKRMCCGQSCLVEGQAQPASRDPVDGAPEGKCCDLPPARLVLGLAENVSGQT